MRNKRWPDETAGQIRDVASPKLILTTTESSIRGDVPLMFPISSVPGRMNGLARLGNYQMLDLSRKPPAEMAYHQRTFLRTISAIDVLSKSPRRETMHRSGHEYGVQEGTIAYVESTLPLTE